jgi:hypothetical protein
MVCDQYLNTDVGWEGKLFSFLEAREINMVSGHVYTPGRSKEFFFVSEMILLGYHEKLLPLVDLVCREV